MDDLLVKEFCYLRDITVAVWISVHVEAAPAIKLDFFAMVTLQRISSCYPLGFNR